MERACRIREGCRQLACGKVRCSYALVEGCRASENLAVHLLRIDNAVVEVEPVNIHNRSHLFLSKSESRPVRGGSAPVRRSYSGVR